MHSHIASAMSEQNPPKTAKVFLNKNFIVGGICGHPAPRGGITMLTLAHQAANEGIIKNYS